MAYTMNSPYKDVPALPSKSYLEGILNGCRQNGIETASILEAVWLTQRDTHHKVIPRKKSPARKMARNDKSALAPVGLRIFLKLRGLFILPKRRLL